MRPKVLIFRKVKPTFGFREEAPELSGHPIVGHQKTVIVAHRNQVAVEEPMCGSGQGEAILDDVRPIICDGSDVGGLNLGPAPAIDDAQTRDRATIVVGLANLEAEVRVADLAVEEKLFGRSGTCGFLERVRGEQEFRLTLQANAASVIWGKGLLKAGSDDFVEVCVGDCAQGFSLNGPSSGAPINEIAEAFLEVSPVFVNRHRIREGNEITHIRIKVITPKMIFLYAYYPRSSYICCTPAGSSRLTKYYPIIQCIHRGFDVFAWRRREVISFCDIIIVFGFRSDVENRLHERNCSSAEQGKSNRQ